MKERIRELANTAGMWKVLHFPHLTEQEENAIEKFAELIVRESADIAKHHVMNISTYSDANFVEKQIIEHFGIKEGE